MYGERWTSIPAISVCKSGVTFNQVAADAFSISTGCKLRVFTCSDPPAIGFKIVPAGENQDKCFTVGHNGRKNLKSVGITCKSVCDKFTASHGKAFKLRLNSGERILQAELNDANKL